MGDRKVTYWVLVGRPDNNGPLGRPGRRCEDNMNMNLQEAGEACTGLIWLRRGTGGRRALVNAVMNLRVP
jgi:hypothetical protein